MSVFIVKLSPEAERKIRKALDTTMPGLAESTFQSWLNYKLDVFSGHSGVVSVMKISNEE